MGELRAFSQNLCELCSERKGKPIRLDPLRSNAESLAVLREMIEFMSQ